MDFKKEIVQYANSIGVSSIGFSDLAFDESYRENFIKQRELGRLSGFEEEDIDKKTDISAIFPLGKSLISIAVPYQNLSQDKTVPYISKSSIGIDYHKVVMDKLLLIKAFIFENYFAESICFCDIGPLSDREVANKSGIGFYGKNANIITKEHGSFVFLGTIITELFIERDFKIDNSCGECNLCIKNCPSGALEEEFCLNAKKCLSFLTQKKAQLTYAEIDSIGTRVYGCDTCQDVCPFNSGIKSNNSKLEVLDFAIELNLEEIIAMTNKAFKASFGQTSLGWRGRKTFLRNLIIAMGNSEKKEYLRLLENVDKKLELEYYINYAKSKINK